MDAKMKNMVMAGMAALCLILGIMAAMGATWQTPEDTDDMEDGMDMGMSLSAMWMSMDLEDETTCEELLDMGDDDMGESECDSDGVMTMTMAFSDICDDEDDDDACTMATAGTIGTIGMWAGIVCALLVTLTLVLPMAGVDAMDAMPDMGKMITSWGAGALMLVGTLAYLMMTPEDMSEEMAMGMSAMMALGAALLGLAAAAMDQFMDADE